MAVSNHDAANTLVKSKWASQVRHWRWAYVASYNDSPVMPVCLTERENLCFLFARSRVQNLSRETEVFSVLSITQVMV